MSLEKSKNKKLNRNRHAFLLTFFSSEPVYQHIEMNGFHLTKFFNASVDEWEVAIYTEEAWRNSRAYLDANQTNFIGKPDPRGLPDLVGKQ
jgi:hypothetical protein